MAVRGRHTHTSQNAHLCDVRVLDVEGVCGEAGRHADDLHVQSMSNAIAQVSGTSSWHEIVRTFGAPPTKPSTEVAMKIHDSQVDDNVGSSGTLNSSRSVCKGAGSSGALLSGAAEISASFSILH